MAPPSMPRLPIRPVPRIAAPVVCRRPTSGAARRFVVAFAALALVLAACSGAATPSPGASGAGGTGSGAPATPAPASPVPSAAASPAAESPGAATETPVASPASPEASSTVTPVPSETPPVPSGTPPARATVVMRDLAFSPLVLNITTGTTVVFTNEDTVGHMPALGKDGVAATNPFFAPIDLPVGASATVVFNAPGTYPITCLIHPAMNMTITVN